MTIHRGGDRTARAAALRIGARAFPAVLPFRRRASDRELGDFLREFAALIDARVPVLTSLDIAIGRRPSGPFHDALRAVRRDVDSGSALAAALAKHPAVFDAPLVALVGAGEATGTLDAMLGRLGVYLEKRARLTKRLRNAALYPAVVLGLALVLITGLLVGFIPVFKELFEDFGAALPGPTQMVIDLSDLVRGYWWLLYPGLIAVLLSARKALATETSRAIRESVLRRTPVVRAVVRRTPLARFTRALGTLYVSGIPLTDALDFAAAASGSGRIERAARAAGRRVARGVALADALAETGEFPRDVTSVIGVGAATGTLDVLLPRIADLYEFEVEIAVSRLTALVGPILTIIVGGGVGGVLGAMYLPVMPSFG